VEDSERNAHAPRVLVVDNNVERRALTAALLGGEGFHVEGSEGGGAAALWLAQTFRPWVVIVTHDLPETDGLEALGMIKGDGETGHLPVILMCPDGADEGLIVEALSYGANNVLTGQPSVDLLMAHTYALLNVFQMVMELREKNHYLRDLVVRDPMTGLFNHAHLHEALEREIARGERYGAPVSLILVDLDNFKNVNDDHGHQAGDYCLKTLSEILTTGGRRSDMAARYGGDEFAIILPDTPKQGATTRGEAIRAAVAGRAFSDIGLPPQTVSIGVAAFPEDAVDRQSLIGAADRALYASKRLGRNRVVGYQRDLDDEDDDNAPIEQLLTLGELIEKAQVRFAYQPIVRAGAGVFGYEALCRPEHSAFPHPGVLFSTAERAGRVAELGRMAREVALRALPDLAEGLRLFLNLHPLELNNALVAEAEELRDKLGGRVVFEITESAQIHDYERMRGLIHRLQASGYEVAVDDLGAGYAGLNSLALLKPDFVKLDMALVRAVENDASVGRLIRHVLDFARGEGIQVVGEGVETARERELVVELGCELLQGYYFAKPAPPFVTPENL
jgi:diguanylate cyclase (GGDEF)-like protein